jgi:thioredoxin 1
MKPTVKIAIVAALVVAVGVVIGTNRRGAGEGAPQVSLPPTSSTDSTGTGGTMNVPRLVELGSTTCIPCTMMAPILEELREEYEGRLKVEFIDVNQDRAAVQVYGIRVIPTQIFFDASGRERDRHEGFISKENILAKWKALGVDFSPDP